MSKKISVCFLLTAIAMCDDHPDLSPQFEVEYEKSSMKMTLGREFGIGHFELKPEGNFCLIQNFDDNLTCDVIPDGVMMRFNDSFFDIYRGFYVRVCWGALPKDQDVWDFMDRITLNAGTVLGTYESIPIN